MRHLAGGIKRAKGEEKGKESSGLNIEVGDERLVVRYGQDVLLGYQAKPMSDPVGGESFKGSNFIHPLRTLSGFSVTDLQPSDHLHHFGLWWPWKYVNVEGRKIICWELQKNEGFVWSKRIVDHKVDGNGAGFVAVSEYVDRTAPGGPAVILDERLDARISMPVDLPARGYFLDLSVSNRCAMDIPVVIVKHRYSGFTLRGAASWNKDNSTVLTSEGKDRDTSNFTRARWVLVQGDTPEGEKAGVLMMGHPGNRDHPQLLRTWNSKQHGGSIFVNFNPVQKSSWKLEPGRDYAQQYRLFVFDGEIGAEEAERLWGDYTGK